MSLILSKNFTDPEVFCPFNIFLLPKIICYCIILSQLHFLSFPLSLTHTYTKSIEGNIENAVFSLFYYKKTLAAARGCEFYN